MGDNGIRSKLGVSRLSGKGNAAYKRAWRSQRTADGLCRECGKPRENEHYKTCQACRRKLTSRTRYIMQHRMRRATGLSQAQMDAVWDGRYGTCEICGVPGRETYVGVLSFDHDHKTGAFRGWLCQRCNIAIGHLESFGESLPSVFAYLARVTAKTPECSQSKTVEDT